MKLICFLFKNEFSTFRHLCWGTGGGLGVVVVVMVVMVVVVIASHLVLHHSQVLQLHLAMDPLPRVDQDAGPILHEVDDVPGVREHVFVVLSDIVGQGVPDGPV